MTNATSRKVKLTNRNIPQLARPDATSNAKEIEYSDTEVTGLRVAVSISGRRFLRFRYTLHGQKRTAKVGEYPAIDIAEARRIALEMRAAVDRGIDPQDQRDRMKSMPTFTEFSLEEYLPYASQHKAASSVASDESKLRIHLIPLFGHRKLCDISTRDVQMHVGSIKESHCEATANRHLALLSKMFNTAILWGKLDRNPCKGVSKFREVLKHDQPLTEAEVQRLVRAMDAESANNVHAAAALKFLLLTGTRREEALQAKWVDIDLDQARWFLPKTKSGKSRHVVLNAEAVKLLSNHPRVAGSPFVYPGRDLSKPLCNPRKAFTRILDSAGLPHMKIHSLRHLHASILVQNGASLYQVQQILGHASVQTSQRYSHLTDKVLRDVSATVRNVISGTATVPQDLSVAA